jgi:hypothetical protein
MLTIKTYYQMPSDCRCDGYDIALAPHNDDQARLEVHPDKIIHRSEVRAGVDPNNGSGGWFVGYKVREITLDDGARKTIRDHQSIRAIVQTVAECLGAWKWARQRGHIRAAIVDTSKHHRQLNHLGYIQTLVCSRSVCLDYPGGKWGYGEAATDAQDMADAVNAMFAAIRAEAAPQRAVA